MRELHAQYENKKNNLVEEMKMTFDRMRDTFTEDDQRLELTSIAFEIRNEEETEKIYADFEDSIALLNNEVISW